MTSSELQAERLTVLPLRLETISISGGPVKQDSWLNQSNFNKQDGGDCLKSNCDQFNWQSNWADVDQKVKSTTTLKDVIDDHSKLAQIFGDGHGFDGKNW